MTTRIAPPAPETVILAVEVTTSAPHARWDEETMSRVLKELRHSFGDRVTVCRVGLLRHGDQATEILKGGD